MYNVDPFDALLYGSSGLINHAANINPAIVQQFITPLAQEYANLTVSKNHFYNSESYLDQIKWHQHNYGHLLCDDKFIARLYQPNDFRLANLNTQRWLMCNPYINQLYVDGKISGYEDTFVNMHGNMIGEDNSDYRHVMNGIVQDDFAHIYVDSYSEEKPPLTLGEIRTILDNWANAKLLIDAGVNDITDPLEYE